MVSIIIPVYKVEKYLSKCIESIFKQTYFDLELILVDDGSPDKCPEICDTYASKDERVVVIHQKNAGVSAARNAGLEKAKGEYIGFVDPDDWIAPEMYKKMISELESSESDLAICGYEYYDEDYHVDEQRRYKVRFNEVVDQKEIMNRFSDTPPSIRHVVWNKVFRKDLLDKQKFKVGLHSSEDVYFLNEYVQKIQRAVIVHQPYYKNLVRQGSATHGGLSIQSLAESFEAHEQMYKDAVKKYPDLKNHSQAFLLDVCTLKYNEAKRKMSSLSNDEQEQMQKNLQEMKQFIKAYARKAIFNKEIYWKTRIYYLLNK